MDIFFLLSFRLLHQGMVATVTFKMLHTNTVNCSLTWTSYKLVNTTMSFQSSYDLSWQIETCGHLQFTTPPGIDCWKKKSRSRRTKSSSIC